MKTLDEVIDKLEKADTTWCNIRGNLNYEDFRDALHYLKDYKKNQEDPDGDHQQLEKAQKILWEFYQNDPLTWQELKGMEGKPVWVEIISKTIPLESSWGIATGGSYKTWQGVESWKLVRPGAEYSLPVAQMGKTWQAYRKERG